MLSLHDLIIVAITLLAGTGIALTVHHFHITDRIRALEAAAVSTGNKTVTEAHKKIDELKARFNSLEEEFHGTADSLEDQLATTNQELTDHAAQLHEKINDLAQTTVEAISGITGGKA